VRTKVSKLCERVNALCMCVGVPTISMLVSEGVLGEGGMGGEEGRARERESCVRECVCVCVCV